MTQRDINPFPYSDDNKRYLTYSAYLRRRFGEKVFKVPLNLGLSCPNRDGTKGSGGCIFCSGSLSGEFAGDPCDDISRQFDEVRAVLHKKWERALYIPYFQAGSNTYADVEYLRAVFERAVSFEGVVGMAVATRADCIDEEKADMLAGFAKRTYLTVELGLQSIHDSTAALCNRCHTYADFLRGYDLLRERGIDVCVHIINGLPHETQEMMLDTARTVGALRPHAIKIHLLHILKNTPLAEMYAKGEFRAMEMDEYISTVCRQLELIPAETVIQRLTGDGARSELIAPMWSLRKFDVMNGIDKMLFERGTYQGALVDNGNTL